MSGGPIEGANCGDANASGQIDIADVVYFVNYIFAGGPALQDDAQGDIDCNNQADIADVVYFVNYIFASGTAPCGGPSCAVGVLLPGNPDSTAVTTVYKFGPVAAEPQEIDSTGLLTTRLEAVLNPAATVNDVNEALNLINGRISWMLSGGLSLTVAIPAVQSEHEADSIGTLLIASGVFLIAGAAFQADLNGTVEMMELPPTGTNEIFHLRQMRMPAAWNLNRLAEDINADVTIFVPDGYYRTIPHPEIPSQSFVLGDGNPELVSTVDGNHGFCTSGIIGARHDDKNTTGVHPDPAGRLSIRSMAIGGLTMPEILSEVVDNMPAGRFVLSTSFGFSKDISDFSKAKRAIQAMDWRRLARPRKDDFIHVTSAGNERLRTDDSRYAALSSAFNTAAAYDSPFDLYTPGEIGPLDYLVLEAYWAYTLSVSPFNALKMDNVIVVGASDVNGNESSFSNLGSLVRVLGEGVAAPCLRVDPNDVDGGCSATTDGLHIAHYDGTSFATPQVAGFAAYLLSLSPTISNSVIYDIIYNAYINSPNPGFVDAYGAVLALDIDIANAAMRFTLLDVADNSFNETPDGVFDEYDIQQFLAKFDEYEQIRAGVPNAPADYSRYDLNGDGYTGGDNFVTRFDLDINNPPQFTSVTIDFDTTARSYDENTLADLDVLCYYANTLLFTGDPDLRDSLMVNCPNCDAASRNAGQCEEPYRLVSRFLQMKGTSCSKVNGQSGVCPVDSLYQSTITSNFGAWSYDMPIGFDFTKPDGQADSTIVHLGIDTDADYDSLTRTATLLLTSDGTSYGTFYVPEGEQFCSPVYYSNGTSYVYYSFEIGNGWEAELTMSIGMSASLSGSAVQTTNAFSDIRLFEVTTGGSVLLFNRQVKATPATPNLILDTTVVQTLPAGRYILTRGLTSGSLLGVCSQVRGHAEGTIEAVIKVDHAAKKLSHRRELVPKDLNRELIEENTEVPQSDALKIQD